MTDQPLSFETAYSKLEEILEKIQSGKVSLEESLHLYEEADRLICWCSQRLTEAESKIEILIKNREGKLQLNHEGQPQKEPFGSSLNPQLKNAVTSENT